jgi:hypothetical protein
MVASKHETYISTAERGGLKRRQHLYRAQCIMPPLCLRSNFPKFSRSLFHRKSFDGTSGQIPKRRIYSKGEMEEIVSGTAETQAKTRCAKSKSQ